MGSRGFETWAFRLSILRLFLLTFLFQGIPSWLHAELRGEIRDDPSAARPARSIAAEKGSCAHVVASLNVVNDQPAHGILPEVTTLQYPQIRNLPYIPMKERAGSSAFRLFDWTREKLALKHAQLAQVVAGMPDPSVLGVLETRDDTTNWQLAEKLGFGMAITTHSQNERGMDVGLQLKESENLQIISRREVPLVGIEFENNRTRNLLVVTVLVAKRFVLHYVVCHWPSQKGPPESRVAAARQTQTLVQQLIEDLPGSEAIVMGDFNTLEDEKDLIDRHPFRDVLSREAGAATLTDLYSVPKLQSDKPQPPGTYYYARGNQWNRLDRFFVTRGLLERRTNGLTIALKSFSIHAPDAISKKIVGPDGKEHRIPWDYDFRTTDPKKAGFTDHFGIYMTVEALWDRPELPAKIFEIDDDILRVNSIILFPKTGSGAKRYISWKEYQAEKESIGKSGKHENLVFRDPESLENLIDGGVTGEINRNALFANFEHAKDLANPAEAFGPRWSEFVSLLSDPDTARQVVIRIPAHRQQSAITVWQLLLYLWEKRTIRYLPRFEHIENMTSAATEGTATPNP